MKTLNPSQTKMMALIKRAMPLPDQITDVWATEANAVRFTWRGATFRATISGGVDQVIGSFLHGSKLALLVQALIRAHAEDGDTKSTTPAGTGPATKV